MAQLREDLYGRTVLYTDVMEVDSSNIGEVLAAAIEDHDQNSNDINYRVIKGTKLMKRKTVCSCPKGKIRFFGIPWVLKLPYTGFRKA